MCFKRIFVALVVSCGWLSQFDALALDNKYYQLMMIGGDLPFCRSSALQLCNTQQLNEFRVNSARKAPRYKVSPIQIEQVMAPKLWHYSRQALRHDLNIVLRELSKITNGQHLSKEQLISRWKAIRVASELRRLSGHSLFASLKPKEKDMLFDFFELPQFDGFSQRIKEQVNLSDKSFSKSRALFERIVEQAKLVNSNDKPNIVFVTSGDRDSFKNVDSFNSIFSQLGANASWLPLDAGLATLLSEKASCSQLEHYRNKVNNNYARERIYPDLVKFQLKFCKKSSRIIEALNHADAVVFTGQSPVLMRQSLVNQLGRPTKVLTTLSKKMRANKLFITSIGGVTLAMSGGRDNQNNRVAMMINGTSEMAFQSGTDTYNNCTDYTLCSHQENRQVNYDQRGGIGLFDIGVIDTQVSINSNFGRLAKVTFDNRNQFGIGLDELTALLVNAGSETTDFELAGFGGGIIIDHLSTTAQSDNMELSNISLSHLTPQDTAQLKHREMSIFYPKWKKTPLETDGDVTDFHNLFYSNNFTKFTQQACITQHQKLSGFAGKKRQFQIDLMKDKTSVLMFGAVKIGDKYDLYCSFEKLNLSIVRRQ